MSKFFKCLKSWRRHSAGDVITEHEYNKMPHEIKKAGVYELIQPVVIAPLKKPVEVPTSAVQPAPPASPVEYSVSVANEPTPEPIVITTDPFQETKHPFKRGKSQ